MDAIIQLFGRKLYHFMRNSRASLHFVAGYYECNNYFFLSFLNLGNKSKYDILSHLRVDIETC